MRPYAALLAVAAAACAAVAPASAELVRPPACGLPARGVDNARPTVARELLDGSLVVAVVTPRPGQPLPHVG